MSVGPDGLTQASPEKVIRPCKCHLFIQRMQALEQSLIIYKHFLKFSKNIKHENSGMLILSPSWHTDQAYELIFFLSGPPTQSISSYYL